MKNTSNSPIAVIIAALNEEEGIGPTIAELKAVAKDSTFIVVDGRSEDRTVEIARTMGVKVLEQEGSGKGRAIAQGIKHVGSARYVVFTDADFTYPAEYVSGMIRILEENPRIGMVTGNRFNHTFRLSSMKSFLYVGNRFLAITQRLLNGVDLKDPLTGLRVVRAEILHDWKPKSKSFDIEAELNHLVEKKGYQTTEIPIHYRTRRGSKKLRPIHGFLILRRIMLESLSSK